MRFKMGLRSARSDALLAENHDPLINSHDGWDGRKKDEDDYLFRLRCWLHAGKVVKNACAPKRKYRIGR